MSVYKGNVINSDVWGESNQTLRMLTNSCFRIFVFPSHLETYIHMHRILILSPELRRMRLVGHAAFIRDIRSTFVTKPEEKIPLWRQDIDVRILIWHIACHLGFTLVKFFYVCERRQWSANHQWSSSHIWKTALSRGGHVHRMGKTILTRF
jgi:hypothetical protein